MVLSRRHFFTQFGRTVVSGISSTCEALVAGAVDGQPGPDAEDTSPRWLRPPGALPEERFLAACTRCTACQEACPYDSIRRLGPEFGKSAGTPAIIPEESPCYLCKDMPCIAACEPEALLPTARREVEMGRAVLRRGACYVAQGQPCDYCVMRCPLRGEAIAFGESGTPVINEAACVGCGVCVYLCPADALAVVPAARLKQRKTT